VVVHSSHALAKLHGARFPSCIGDLQARQCQIDYLSELAYIALRSANVAQRNLPDRERLIAAFEIATELLAKLAEACSLVSGLTTNDPGTAERLNQCFHDLDGLNEQWANRINTYHIGRRRYHSLD